MASDGSFERASVVPADLGWPSTDGEPVFAEPWEGRAFGLAADVVRRSGHGWDDFRDRLIVAIAEDPERAYYASWLTALERFVVECVEVDPSELAAARARVGVASPVQPGA